jgi:hypothetical protein
MRQEYLDQYFQFVERALARGVLLGTNVSIVAEPFSPETPLRWTAHFSDAPLPNSTHYRTKDAGPEAVSAARALLGV